MFGSTISAVRQDVVHVRNVNATDNSGIFSGSNDMSGWAISEVIL